jgi:hypothetical protein
VTKASNLQNPRKAFFVDLQTILIALKQQGNAIILMLDANDELRSTGEFATFLETVELHDVHQYNHAPSTYIGSSNRRIDYILASNKMSEFIKGSGTLSDIEGPQSDHRGLFVDINLSAYLSYNAKDNTQAAAPARTLRTGNPELVGEYTKAMLSYYNSHSMEKRIDMLYTNFSTMSSLDIRKELESWDRDQGRAMKTAEAMLLRPKQPYEWSPKLRNAAITRRYWRLRLREAKYTNDFTKTIQRLQAQIQQYDHNFKFPLIDVDLSLIDIRSQLKQATKDLHEIQKDASEMRFKTYQDLLAIYTADNDPVTRPDSNKKAKIVKRTIRTERIRAMFCNIRTTLSHINPSQQSGLTQIKIPIINNTTSPNPEEFQAFIATTPSNASYYVGYSTG